MDKCLFHDILREHKPLKTSLFDKYKHLNRDGLTKACIRCGIKVIWKGDEYRYKD